ncbi:OmpA family protein [Flavobacterium sp. Sr18]|uniref:OmpA family protein n=1 Tax=Flavobacterium sp. Sr18 TaxID=935222 RepID=UPI0013E50A13|nr:OmpA family protein [Flavobacterium sp. Sr18]QIH40024.1 OmpA family protein [Flavobacterium sp. Sr18]
MRKIKTPVYNVILLLVAVSGYGQKARIEGADKKYNNYSYIDAIATYESVALKGYKDEKMFQKLGNAYYFNADLNKAEKWYTELFDMNGEQEPEYYYRYSQALKSIRNYDKANKMLDTFNKRSVNDLRAKLYVTQKNYLEEIKANSGRYTIANAGINSEYSDYGSSFFNNNLVFASARDTGRTAQKIFKWTNQSFTNLYSSEINTDGNLGNPKRFSKIINSKFHESTPIFTKDGQTMYFTRNNYLDGKKGKDAQKVTLLKIYKSSLKNGNWTNIVELPFNGEEYSVAHPALSTDESTLYFVSDMPGTFGQSDLFKVAIKQDGTYGEPKNLGTEINTEGRETFPFVSGNNELYFASDGRPGLGGLDIFVTNIGNDNTYGVIQNVGEPINGPQDDFAFLINTKDGKGFFTSNRSGGLGYDDIYSFTETRKLICEQLLAGILINQETGQPLVNAKISMFDDHFTLVKEMITDDKGNYSIEVVCGKTYYIRATKDDYETKEEKITIKSTTGKTDLPFQLSKRIKEIGVGTDLAKTLDIPIIYFDLDKSIIRKDATFELAKIVVVMQQFPKMKIDVRSHTDSRQTEQYNLKLSDKRAKSTIEWLIKNGIEDYRLSGKGYGEAQLVNKCSDGVKCIESEHQANRRSEFIIISIE